MQRSKRTRFVLAAAAALSAGSAASDAATRQWVAGYGTWSTAANWSPNGMPSSADVAALGGSASAHDAGVSLDVNATLAGLSITDGMSLDGRYQQLTVNGSTTVSGTNYAAGGRTSELLVRHNFANPYDFRTTNLTIGNGARLVLDGSSVNVMGSMLVDGTSGVFGAGTLNFFANTGPVFVLDGDLDPGTFGSGPSFNFTLNQYGAGRIDLDGGVIGDGAISVTGYHDSFTVNGDQLYDAFDDVFYVGQGCDLNMNLTDGWTLGTGGWCVFLKTGISGDARLAGGTVTVNGTITFLNGSEVVGRVDAPLVVNTGTVIVGEYDTLLAKQPVTLNGGRVNLFEGSVAQFDAPVIVNSGTVDLKTSFGVASFNGAATLNGGHFRSAGATSINFNGTTTVNGGTFDLAQGGLVNFNGPTKLVGGTFNTFSANPGGGQVRFNGATEYAGALNMTGIARQNGPATVTAPTSITAGVFDMDGESALTSWTINAPLSLAAQAINTGNNTFTGSMSLVSSPASPGRIAVNLPAGQAWTMAGTMSLVGSGFGTVTDVIAGSDVNLSGRVTASFDTAVSARVNFAATNVTTINTSSSLRLDGGGGSLGTANTISGATIQGAGTLKSSAGRALWGRGTINTAVGFGGGDLRADGGTLTLGGAIASVGVIGAQAGSTLRFGLPFDTAVATRLEVNGGTILGPTITNTREARGFGAIASAGFVNNGSVNVSNGTLVVDTSGSPDLDGSTEAGRVLVSGGTLHVVDPIADGFNGIAAVGAGGAARFDQPWTLASGGLLSLSGSTGAPGVVAAPSQSIAGTVVVQAGSRGQFDAKTTFAPAAAVTINASSQLDLLQDGTVTAGAGFAGAGTLRVVNGARLTLANNAAVGVAVRNEDVVDTAGFLSAGATVAAYSQSPGGKLQVKLHGVAPGTQFDRVDVTGSAALAGELSISAGLYNPGYLVPHEIVHAGGGVNGVFSSIAGVPLAPAKYLAVTYDADSVFVTAALPGDANLDGTVGIADFATLAAHFNNSGTWALGSFDGNTAVNLSDFALLAGNFNLSVPTARPAAAAVPEPGVPASLVAAAAVTLRRRGRRAW